MLQWTLDYGRVTHAMARDLLAPSRFWRLRLRYLRVNAGTSVGVNKSGLVRPEMQSDLRRSVEKIRSSHHSSATPWWQDDWLPVCVTVMVAWPFATLGVYRTTETVSLFSTHGAARLQECTGGLGTFHVFRPFMAKLAAHIRLASAARRRTKTEHLRDEMREHLRLKEIGVLPAGEYETAKVRILD
jgi:hypothetical protein